MYRMQGMFDAKVGFFYYPVGENLDLCRLIRELNEDKNVNLFFYFCKF